MVVVKGRGVGVSLLKDTFSVRLISQGRHFLSYRLIHSYTGLDTGFGLRPHPGPV